MKRFYEKVSTAPAEGGGFAVLLDGRPVRTPAKAPLLVPTLKLAEALAEEWRAQGGTVEPSSMPLNRLAASTVDLFPARLGDARREVVAYATTDLLCYRTPFPPDLAARQRAAWDPWLAWARAALGAALIATDGLAPVGQPKEALAALAATVEGLDPWRLMGLHAATRLAGSLVLGLAVAQGRLVPDAAFDAAFLEELYEIEAWGLTDAQARRHAALRAEFAAVARFFDLL
ncbi:MAG: ATPase [Geminicoccaceae bacterium]|nr:ATPase [Geminicoccaceae bacterium]